MGPRVETKCLRAEKLGAVAWAVFSELISEEIFFFPDTRDILTPFFALRHYPVRSRKLDLSLVNLYWLFLISLLSFRRLQPACLVIFLQNLSRNPRLTGLFPSCFPVFLFNRWFVYQELWEMPNNSSEIISAVSEHIPYPRRAMSFVPADLTAPNLGKYSSFF